MVRSSSIKNRRGHLINKKISCGDFIGPKMYRDIYPEQKGPEQSQEDVYSFSKLSHSERVFQHTRYDGESHVVT